ncbi:PIN domain-containing protein [Streptomyces sp. NPDC059852]|uniref:PIN domain-containing protein n=1 Tax=Streptomyces sp. NPDC059852 TaxID=3346972 RepID=UPI00365A297A
MIVLLDTTAFVADPHCSGTAWRVLAHATSAWNVRIVVPRVVIQEAVAGYRRRANEALVGLQRQKDKNGGALGISAIYDKARADIEEEVERYSESLEGHLNEIGAEFLDPPAIGHLELVERSTQRRKPCDGNGNGYRDTLNWISVLQTAKETDEEVIWVSDNSNDFGSEEGDGLHEELAEEVAEVGAEGRVRWLKSLSELVLQVTSERWPEFSDDLRQIQERLQGDSMATYLNHEVLATCMERRVSPRMCGLPIHTSTAKIMAVGALTESKFTVRGASAGEEGIIEFRATCPTTVLVELPVTADIEGLEVNAITEEGVSVWVEKDLQFAGIVTSDRFGRPVSGEVTTIGALPDDPGRTAWSRTSISSHLESLRAATVLDPKVIESFRTAISTNSKIAEMVVTPLIDPKVLEAMRRPLIDPKVLEAMRKPLIDPKLLEWMRAPIPGLSALQQLRGTSRREQGDVGTGSEVERDEETSPDDDSASDD